MHKTAGEENGGKKNCQSVTLLEFRVLSFLPLDFNENSNAFKLSLPIG